MKQFMMLFVSKDYSALGLSPEEMQERMGKWFAWNQSMQEQGIVKGGEALHGDARLVSGPQKLVTDRAATAIKEIVGGYYTIEVENMDAAQKVAENGYPDYDIGGTVEIREVVVFDS